jgi:hypothetical protein
MVSTRSGRKYSSATTTASSKKRITVAKGPATVHAGAQQHVVEVSLSTVVSCFSESCHDLT